METYTTQQVGPGFRAEFLRSLERLEEIRWWMALSHGVVHVRLPCPGCGQIVLNKDANEFDLFTQVRTRASCGDCKVSTSCMGGCPAEEIVMGAASCAAEPDIVPVCRLWKADVPTGLST